MTIGIIVAMDKERDLVVSRLQHIDERVEHQQTFTDGRMGQHRIVLLQCGIGKVAAAVGAVELIRRYQPDCIINTGVAGALSSAVNVMDVVCEGREALLRISHRMNGESIPLPGYGISPLPWYRRLFRPKHKEVTRIDC